MSSDAMPAPDARQSVLDRLDALRGDSKRAERVCEYVASGRTADVSTTALLWVLRADPDLALELRASTGRHVIAADTGSDGRTKYPYWAHSAVRAKAGIDDVRNRSLAARSVVADVLEDRRPHVRLRSETPLAGLALGDERVATDGGVDIDTPATRPEAKTNREEIIEALEARLERGNTYVKSAQIAEKTSLTTQQVAANFRVFNEAGLLEPWRDATANSGTGGRVYRIVDAADAFGGGEQ